MSIDAVVLSGGRGSRLGGVDKGAIVVHGKTLLERALDAVSGLRTVVVGPEPALRPPCVDATWVREDPPFSGPVAALATGLEALHASCAPASATLVVAVDLPELGAALPALRAGTAAAAAREPKRDVDGWVAVDPDGRRQPLLALYRTERLRAACASLEAGRGTLDGGSMRALLAPLRLIEVPLGRALTADVDTPDQLAAVNGRIPAGDSGGRR